MDNEEITALISEYIQCEDTPTDMRELAKAIDGLPIYSDMGGCIVLLPDKTFVGHPWDTDEFNREGNPAWQIVALVYGVRKYPSLAPLLPTRSADAQDCQPCKCTGHPIIGDKTFERAVCGKCFGLGWVDRYIESLKL